MKQVNLKLNYQVPISESAYMNDDFIITGVALNAITTSNNHKFLPEELEKSAKTLSKVPLLKDHNNSVDATVGRVLSGEYNDANERIDFRAHVIDENMKAMIKDGRIDSVSVGADVKEVEETDDGFIPHGITFRELSLVAVPADPGATFQVALQEAYEMVKVNEGYSNANEVEKAMAKFNKTNFKSTEERNESREEILKAGRKYKVDTTEFEKATSAQTEAKNNNIIINKSGGKIMESEDEKKQEAEKAEQVEAEKLATEEKEVEAKLRKANLELKKKELEVVEKQLKEADEDEKPKESEESEEPKSKEDEGEEEDEEDEKPVSESYKSFTEKGYKVEQGHGSLKGGSFTLVRP